MGESIELNKARLALERPERKGWRLGYLLGEPAQFVSSSRDARFGER
jgi:hypothetical protein